MRVLRMMIINIIHLLLGDPFDFAKTLDIAEPLSAV
jgi:hypothetical protein